MRVLYNVNYEYISWPFLFNLTPAAMNNSLPSGPRRPRPVAPFLLLLVWLLLPGGALVRAQAPAFDRAAVCGQPASGSLYVPYRLAVDAAGNAYVAGYFRGSVVFGATILTSAPDAAGRAGTDWFVAKLDPLGAVAWAVRAGGPSDDQALDLCLDGLGHVFAAGTAQGQAAFGALNLNNNPNGGPRVVVARLDAATGAWQWLAQGGGSSNNQTYAVAADGAGHVFVTGALGQRGLYPDFGSLTGPGFNNGEAAYVARLDAGTGAWQWASFGLAAGGVKPQTLALDGAGGVYVGGNYASTTPVQFGPVVMTPPPVQGQRRGVFAAKLDAGTGTWQWANWGGGYGPNGVDLLQSLAADGAGNVVAAGYFLSAAPPFGATTLINRSGNNQFGFQISDGFVAGLNAATGAWRWAVPVSGPGDENCSGVALDGAGEAYVAGGFAGPTTFGAQTLTAPAGYDAYVARLSAATGAWRWVAVAGGRGSKGATSPVVAGNQLYVTGGYTGAVADFGPVALAGSPADNFGFVARLAGATTPLAGRAPVGAGPGLAVWPSPARGAAWVSGPAPGTPVRVLDALGRAVGAGVMPAAGPLALPLALPAGCYLVRAGPRTARLLVE